MQLSSTQLGLRASPIEGKSIALVVSWPQHHQALLFSTSGVRPPVRGPLESGPTTCATKPPLVRILCSAALESTAFTSGGTRSYLAPDTPLPNHSLKASANGVPPGPGRQYGVHFSRPGPGATPLSPP